jgi:hypothetical protein
MACRAGRRGADTRLPAAVRRPAAAPRPAA